MSLFQNLARGFSRGCPDREQAPPQPAGSPPQRIRRAPEIQGQARCRFPSLDGRPEPLWLPENHHSNKVSVQLQCGLQTRQMQGHVVIDQRRIVENQDEHSHILAALYEKLESVHEKLDHIVENRSNRSNLEQVLHTFAACFDDSQILSTHSPASDPIDLLKPTIPMPLPVFATA